MKLRLSSAAPAALALALAASGCATGVHAPDETASWVVRGAKLYTAPDQPPIAAGVVVIRGDRIVAAGPANQVAIPPAARESPCSAPVLAAGFQNSHVHFIGAAWTDAARRPAAELSRELTAMLTRYGYATVFDIASLRDDTLALRARIERGDIAGPRILTVGLPLFPADGLPAYLLDFPREFRDRMPQPATPEAAVRVVQDNLNAGADATKLFLVTPQQRGVKRMPADIARAAADATHARGKLVFAHPTDIPGVAAALAAGVDILAHTTHGELSPWPDALRDAAVKRHVSVIPTLQLMGYELKKENVPPDVTQKLIAASVAHVKNYADAGGEILFGTDVGYMSVFDPTEEYVLMAKAGLTPMQILASLTTTPAARWHEENRRGRLAAGMDADLVALDADPASDPANFTKVRCTISRGKTIYAATPK